MRCRKKYFKLVLFLLCFITCISFSQVSTYADTDKNDTKTEDSTKKDTTKKSSVGIIIVGDSRTAGMQSAYTHENLFYVCESGKGYSWYKDTGHSKVKETMSSNSSITNWKVIYNLGVNDVAGSEASSCVSSIKGYLPDLIKEFKNTEVYYMNVTPINDSIYSSYRTNQLHSAGQDGGYIMTNKQISSFNSEMSKIVSWNGTIDLSSLIKDDMISKADGSMGIHYDSATYKKLAEGAVEKAGGLTSTDTSEGGSSNTGDSNSKTNETIQNIINSYQSSEDDLPGMDKKQDWGEDTPNLPDGSDLTQNEKMQLNKWKSDVNDNKGVAPINFFRTSVAFTGILVIIYALLLYLAYWLDRVNNVVEFSFLSILTLGKLAVSPDEIQSTFSPTTKGLKIVTHKDIITVVILCLIVGVFLVSGKIYFVVTFFIDKLEKLSALF